MGRIVIVNDKMQKNYSYELTEPSGKNFHPHFKPQLTPAEMLKLGVFGGRYMTDCKDEFPKRWFKGAKLYKGTSPDGDKNLNFFKVHASQALSVWKKMDGFVLRIREDGFNGIAVIIWAEELKMIFARSKDGKPSFGTLHRSKKIVLRVI